MILFKEIDTGREIGIDGLSVVRVKAPEFGEGVILYLDDEDTEHVEGEVRHTTCLIAADRGESVYAASGVEPGEAEFGVVDDDDQDTDEA